MHIITPTLRFILSIIYSWIIANLIYYIFYWATPLFMNMNWRWFILYSIVCAGLVPIILSQVSQLLTLPLIYLTKGNLVSKILSALIYGYNGFYAVIMPWCLDGPDYGVLQYIIAISISFEALSIFGLAAIIPFNSE